MKEHDNKTYEWHKKHMQQHYTVDDTGDYITVRAGKSAFVKFNKNTHEYTAYGFGGTLSFTTYPIYDDWRAMIKAWLREKQTNNRWVAERKEE